MDRPDVEEIRKFGIDKPEDDFYDWGHIVVRLCNYILLLEARDGWTHQGAMSWFKDCCSLIGLDPVPYSWFARLCRSYGYEIPIGAFRRFANSGRTILDLNWKRGGAPFGYFAAICENVYNEQKAETEDPGPTPPYRNEYEGAG